MSGHQSDTRFWRGTGTARSSSDDNHHLTEQDNKRSHHGTLPKISRRAV